MNIIWSIISSIFILYVWIRLINTVFWWQALKAKIIWKVLIMWIVSVWTLFAYKYLLTKTNNLDLYFFENLDLKTTTLFSIYCIWIILIIISIFGKRAKIILKTLFILSLFFLIVNIAWIFLWINTLILYYIISAYAEEYLKFNSSTILSENTTTWVKDLIFFCIILWLSFSVVENVLYLASVLIQKQQINISSFIIGRWLISALLHVVATTSIAYITYSLNKKINWIVASIIWIIAWLAIHSTYNLSLEYKINYISIPLIIMMFFLLSYFLFKSDLLYKKKA